MVGSSFTLKRGEHGLPQRQSSLTDHRHCGRALTPLSERLLTSFHSCFVCHLSSLFSCCFVSKRHSVPYSRSGSTNVRNALTLDRSLNVPDFHVLRLSRVNACDAACTLAFTSFCELAFTSIFVPRYLADVVALIVMPRTLNFSLPRATLF